MNVNRVTLAGNLTRDPELKFSGKGTGICKFGLATTRRWKTETAEPKEETVFVDVDCFGKTAENISQHFKKGSRIYVEGRLKLEQWDDKQTGQKRQKLGVICESFQFVDRKGETNQAAPTAPAPTTAAQPEEDDQPPF